MGVSQQAIADALGLSRTTVTKILNRDPKYSASEATRDLVFSTAEKMGYDHSPAVQARIWPHRSQCQLRNPDLPGRLGHGVR
jgi:DNA-binding LacI/PurR family transcriptional regulator